MQKAPSPVSSYPPPSIDDAKAALVTVDITAVLQPKRVNGFGHKPFTAGRDALRLRLAMMKMHLSTFTAPDSPGWIAASLKTAQSFQRSSHTAKNLRSWAHSFVADRNNLPKSLCGSWNVSLFDKGELAKEIHLHLMGIGKYVKAMDIVHFVDTPAVKQRYGLKKKISLSTARRWMYMMDYHWMKAPSGQYVDGHEREDVVTYRIFVYGKTGSKRSQVARIVVTRTLSFGGTMNLHSMHMIVERCTGSTKMRQLFLFRRVRERL